MSQLDLALAADISQRHLSFIESGRARPSRKTLMNLAERLHIPLRSRNPVLVAAGYAPYYPEGELAWAEANPAMEAIETVLAAHEPAPALVIDRHWNLVRANRALLALIAEVPDPTLLGEKANVLRLSLSPGGLAARIVNYPEWRGHILDRLRGQIEQTGDSTLSDLYEELRCLPSPSPLPRRQEHRSGLFVPLRLRVGDEELSLISMTTVFGTPIDILTSELAIESFLPADQQTAAILRRLCPPGDG